MMSHIKASFSFICVMYKKKLEINSREPKSKLILNSLKALLVDEEKWNERNGGFDHMDSIIIIYIALVVGMMILLSSWGRHVGTQPALTNDH